MGLIQKIGKLLQRGLVMEIAGVGYRFANPDEFDTFLRARLEVSPEEISRFAEASDLQVQELLKRTNTCQQRLLEMHLMTLETGKSVDVVWSDMDASYIPDDHQWQSLIFSLGDESGIPEAYRERGLVRLLEYLRTRKDVLQEILRQKSQDGPESENKRALPHSGERDSMTDEKTDVAMTQGVDYKRMPPGAPLVMNFPDGEYVSIYLARQRIRVKAGDDATLMDDRGNVISLSSGKTIVGRSRGCDIILDASPNDVSRQHLVIETTPDRRLLLTDISSRGTFVPARALPG
ncbi:MAG: FHA domain-containing protein [Gammaproteobacteria bacterium]